MKRYLNWVLGGLAAATAVLALRPRRQTPEQEQPDEEPTRPLRWFDEPLAVLKAVVGRLSEHHMPMIAGSLSYYAFLAIFPAAIAAASIYGLVLDPDDLAGGVKAHGQLAGGIVLAKDERGIDDLPAAGLTLEDAGFEAFALAADIEGRPAVRP